MSVSLGPRGLTFARFCVALTRGDGLSEKAAAWASNQYGDKSPAAVILKAAVGSGSTRPDGSWGSALADFNSAAAEFFGLVREADLIGRMAGLRRTPLGIQVLKTTSGSTAYWVKQGHAKPVSRLSFARDVLKPLKLASMCVLTQEMTFFSDPVSERFIIADLVRSTAEARDLAFIDPDNAGIAESMPSSVTIGAPEVSSTGDPAADIRALIDAFGGDLASAYLIMHPNTAASIGMARDAGGSFQFPDAGVRGGSILGIPMLTSRMVPIDSSGGLIALVDAAGIAIGEGGTEVRTTREASIEMDDAPVGDSVTPTGSSMVSLFETNSSAILVELETNWQRVRAGSVAIVTGANYS